MLYYMNSDTGKVIAREIGDEPFGDLWFEISREEYEETLRPLSPANTGLQSDLGWVCGECEFTNLEVDTVCQLCTAAKPQAAKA